MEHIKVLYNECHGGFGFSDEFALELGSRIGEDVGHAYKHYRYREHPEAIKLFEEKGSKWSSGDYSSLKCADIPKFLENYWSIHEYDGKEEIIINFSYAIECTVDEYLENENLELFKEKISRIKSSRDEWNKL